MSTKEQYTYKPKGVVEDNLGRVAGWWIKGRKGRKETFFFEKPIDKLRHPFRIEHKTMIIDGMLVQNYPVWVYPEANSLNHWNKHKKEK